MLTRSLNPELASPPNQPRVQLEGLLDNVRSAWNVGAMFRTADGIGVSKLYLCGITPTPESKEVRKTALGAQESIVWEYSRNAVNRTKQLIEDGARLWALEQDTRSIAIGETLEMAAGSATNKRIVLVVGNEVTGVDPALLDLCEYIVHIPMRGQKRSLNVEVAFGIAAHHLSISQK